MGRLKKALVGIASFLVAVLAIILALTVDMEWIRSLVSSAKIASSSSGTAGSTRSEYLTGEIVQFWIEGVQATKVIWFFEEAKTAVGSVEAQYAFQFDPALPVGRVRDHRIDAFYKSGDRYLPLSAVI